MDSLVEDDPTLPVNFGESINFSQLPNVTAGADITAANFSDHFPDTSAPAIQKVGGSGRMSPVRAHTMKEYEQQISDLKKENFSLKLRIYFMEERMQQKFEDNDDITTNIELKVEVESLKKELTEKQQLLVKASNAVESLAHEKDVIAEKMKEEKDDALSQLKEQLDGKCRRIQLELDELQQANQGLQNQLDNASSSKENLEGDLYNKKLASQKQHMDNKEALAEKDRVIEQLNSALRAKDQIIGKLNDEKVLTARKTVQPLQEEVNKLKEQLQDKQDQIEDMEKDADRGKDRDKERIRKQYEDVYLEQEKRVHELEDATEKLQDEINNKTKNVKDIGNALMVSQKVIKELDRKVKDKDGEIETLESEGKKEAKAKQGLTEMIKAKDKEIQQLCDQIEDMEEALTRANERVNKAERKKHEGIEQQQSSLSELEERLADMRSQLHTKDLDNERLQRSMTRKQHEIERLKDDMREVEDQTDGMAKQKDDTIKLLKDQLQDSKAKSKENADAIEQHYQNLLDDNQHQLDLKEKSIQRLTKGLQEKDRLVKEYMELAKNASLPDAQQASTESILQDLRDKLADRDKAIQEANEEKIKAVDAKEAELRALKHSLRDHQRDLEKANGDMMEDANRLGELEAKMKDLDNKNKQLSDSVKALNKANHDAEDNHHRSLGEKDAIISRLQSAIASKERELEEERDTQNKNRERNGAAQNVAIQQLNERLRDKDKQLEDIVSERAQVAAANEKATQDLLQTIRDKDTQIKELNDRYNRALVDKSNALRDLQRQVNEKEYELQNAEETLARADHEQGALLGKMRNALSEKDKTIEKLLESGREKDRLFLEMQQSAVRASPSPSHNAEMTRLKDENDRLNREIEKLTDLLARLRSQKPDEDYVTSLKEDLNNKNKLLAKAKESLESLQDEQEAEKLAKQNAAKLRRRILELEDELQAKGDRINELNNAGRIKDSLIKELKLEINRVRDDDQSPRGSDSSEQLQQLMQEQIRELSRLTSALHANLPLNVNITHQSETSSTRGASHDDRDRNSLRDVLGAELAAMQTLRRQIEEGMGRRNDNHLHVVIDRQGAVQSSTTSGVGSGVGSDSNDISPTITTASEAQRRSFGVGHDPESIQPPPLFSQDTGLYIPVPQPSLSLEELSFPTAATKEDLQREVTELRSLLKDSKQRQQTLEKRLEREELESLRSIPGHDLTDPTAATREELQREVADLRSKLKDAKRRYQSLEKRIEREELESLRSVPGQETDGDPQVISGLQKDLTGLRMKLRESERHNTTLKHQLDAALLNQASSDSSGDHVVPILKQQLDQAKALLEEENHKLQAAEQQNAALRHHLGIGPESPPDSGRDLVDNLKLENEHLASQLQEAVERAQGRQQDTQNKYGQTAGASADGVQVALLQKKLDKAQNLIELLKRHIRLNGSGADGQEREFNPELIVDMAKEIERLRKELNSAQDQEQVSNDETANTRRTRSVRGASSSCEVVMPPSLHKQLEKAQLEMNATKRRFKALTLKLHATEGTVHQQAERIKRYRRQLHNMGLPAPGTPKRVSSDSNLLNASTYAQANRRLSAVSLSQIPSSDDDRDSTSSASLTPSERSVGAADVTFSGFGLTNDTDELKEQVAVLKKQLKRCRHVIRKLQVRIQNGGLSRPSSPSRDPSNQNPWFELVANRAAFERLQQDLENVTSQLEKVMDANASLRDRNQELLSELVELQTQKQNSFSEEVIRSQELEIGRLHEQLAELRSLMGVLTNMLAEALGILKGLEKENKTALEGAFSERVTVIEERLQDGTEVVDTIKRLIGDESQFGRRQSETDVRELFSDRLRVKDEQMQQLRDEIRGQQKLNRELQEILHNNQLKADSMKDEIKRLRSEQTMDTKTQEDLERQRKQNQDMQEILRKQEQRAEAARKDLEREYEKEIIILHDRLEEARKMNDKHREKSKKSASTESEHSGGQGTIYLHETNIKLTTENSVLQKRLREQEDKTYRVKAELDRANKEIKRLLSEKHRLSDQTQRLQDQVTDNEQLANSLRFELSIYEQLHQKDNSSRSPGSRGRAGEHSPSHHHVIDRTTGVDLSELLKELRHLRIQLERSIDTNNALRIRLEEALREKTLSPNSGKESPRTTVISEEVRIHSSSSSTRRRSSEDRTKSSSARKLFTDGKTQKHPEGNGHLDEDFAIHGIGHLYGNGESRVKKSSSMQSNLSDGTSKKESYAVSMATTYEAVRSGVKEAAVVGGTIEVLLREKLSRLAQVVEERSPHSRGDLVEVESEDHILLTTLAHDVRRLIKLLNTSKRHLVNFWMTDQLVQQHSQSDEVKELRKRLGAQERLMKEAHDRLVATNREKESMEDAIIRQLCKTHHVIQKAKGNLQTVES
ncbi:myomegalin-like isoform X3 [Lytechinus variegatus]|uniref:myomegalin-like isoform X3 n=1 Tax=Lytechinus variegatus TaxID=7654 RepID=UPI001BB0DCF0|nr:myomegalin-like isoform X3 [Lytechinus variegatus]